MGGPVKDNPGWRVLIYGIHKSNKHRRAKSKTKKTSISVGCEVGLMRNTGPPRYVASVLRGVGRFGRGAIGGGSLGGVVGGTARSG